jgi:putative flavoprotein involved in K+ transport
VAERLETVVIGGGQAGLSVSYHLTNHDRPHIVLEQGRVAETWRTQRWDSFRLNTPNLILRLPGQVYAGDDPEGFLTRDETVAYIEAYAEAIEAPVRTGVHVASVEPAGGRGYRLDTSEGPLEAGTLVVATGSFRLPAPLPLTNELPSEIRQLHAGEYRNPAQLPPGAVLIVGSGQSGCQIAADLLQQGREVYLSVGRCNTAPLYYRGRQLAQWLIDLGMMDDTVDTLPSPSARLACNPVVTSDESIHHCGPGRLARDGVVLLGRVEAIAGWKAVVRPDLEESLAAADEFAARLRHRIDEHVRDRGLDVPEELPSAGAAPAVTRDVRELDLRAAGVGTVLWANGYRPDFSWIRLPIFDGDGYPIQARGVSDAPGLYFVGLHWLHTRKSGLLLGVGEDAEYVVSRIIGSPNRAGDLDIDSEPHYRPRQRRRR